MIRTALHEALSDRTSMLNILKLRSRRPPKPVVLLAAQGPQQLLVAVAALKYYEACGHGPYRVVPIIGHFYSSPCRNRALGRVCRLISRQVGFCRPIDISDIEAIVRARQITFQNAVLELRRRIGHDEVGIVLVARNGQLINELVLAAAGPMAMRVVYGDGLGIVDLNKSWGEPVYNPLGYMRVQEAWLTIPVEYSQQATSGLKVRVVPPEYYLGLVQSTAARNRVLNVKDKRWIRANDNRKITLCFSGQMSEACITKSVPSEVEMYMESLAPFLCPGDRILIKPHPRSKSNQAEMIASRLRDSGFSCHVLSSGMDWPAELLGALIPLDKVLSLCSNAGIMLAWQAHHPTQVGLNLNSMAANFHPEHKAAWDRHLSLLKHLVKSAYRGKFSLIRFDDLPTISAHERPNSELLSPLIS